MVYIFFCKQKTAYEMRISDWSSDVCSSDLKSMFEAIEKAKDHINLETYIFDPDEAGQRFADALIAKQQSGVQVNIIYDSVGALNTPEIGRASFSESGCQYV